jgi:hypothetical protein
MSGGVDPHRDPAGYTDKKPKTAFLTGWPALFHHRGIDRSVGIVERTCSAIRIRNAMKEVYWIIWTWVGMD